jgi:NAD(P)-dependent dehydrogenase (short-subunit alcohol dehydrogenase family)
MQGLRIAVTGGFGVLGAALGGLAVRRGARVALIDHADAPRGETPPDALVLGGVDLTDLVAARDAFARVATEFGGLDGLANIAGGYAHEKVADGGLETWDRLYALNVKTAVSATKAALPLILASERGRIVNVGAAAAVRGGAGNAAYAAAKSGVMRLTEALAEELKATSATVNAVLPSIIDTPANRAEMGEKNAHKWVSPEALAEVILFLMSDAARAVTGALIPAVGRV